MDINILQDYLLTVLDCNPTITVADTNRLPGYITRTFTPKFGEVFSTPVCFLFAPSYYFNEHTIQDITGIVKVFKNLMSIRIPIFVFDKISRQERQSLVRQRICFIVPEQQMFLPHLGIAFSERIKEELEPLADALPPAAQALLIRQLLSGKLEGLAAAQIGKIIGYTTMTAARAMDQAHTLGLCKVHFDGYRKTIHFDSARAALWEKAKPFMRSPVKKTVGVFEDTEFANAPYAGEYALSKLSNLHANRKCFAVLDTQFNQLVKAGQISIAKAPEIGNVDVEVWAYPPIRIGETVDALSLELSFINAQDARILASLLEIRENRQW